MSSVGDVFLGMRDRVGAFVATRKGKVLVRVFRGVLLVGVLGFLVFQLSDIGWGKVWDGLPRTPWFYVFVLAMYFILPVTEAAIFGGLWHVPRRRLLGVSLRKRALNADVLGYSGDVYFAVWAHRQLGLSEREVWRVYKDNTVLGTIASFFSAALLLALLWFSGQIAFADLLRGQSPVHLGIGLALVVALVSAVLAFRRAIFSLPARTIALLFLVHVGRFALSYALQIAQWWVVLPDAPLEVWGTMLAVMIVMNRLPLMPARDLVSIGAILGMSDLLAASEGVIAGMLLARSGIDRLLNLGFFGGSLLWERRHPLGPAADATALSDVESANV